MPLKTRVVALVTAAVLTLCALFAVLLGWREQELTARYHESLLQSQRIAWGNLQQESLATLQEALGRVTMQPGWAQAWERRDRPVLARLLADALPADTQWRADVFDGRRAMVYSSSAELRQEPLLEAGWLSRALLSERVQAGLSQVSRDGYYLVAARRFGRGTDAGVLALGLDMSQLLPQLAATLAGDTFLLNLRGREVAGTRPGTVQRVGLPLPVRLAQVSSVTLAGTQALAVVQPLAGPDQRRVGALLLLRDATQAHADDRRALTAVAGGVLLFIVVLGGLLLAQLRRAMRPLERSVHVLGALSHGDLRAALDDDDLALRDEAGQIARGVAALRHEMLNLQMLRDERIRTSQQQERLIRRQLKVLAESLDDASREEILAALEPAVEPAAREAHNALAELARILAQLSGLVTSQQGRLVGLLQELREAMRHQAVLVGLQQELQIARDMQRSILPRRPPATRAVEVAALMVPAKEVGGDFYDYFLVDDAHLALVIADVSGKGIPAAFFMAISRTLLKSSALLLREPAQVMARLNDQLCADNDQMMFVTAFFGVLHLPSGRLDFVNAGHNPPLVRHRHGEVAWLPGRGNTALAVVEGLAYTAGTAMLARGDALLLYTDGVTEATDSEGRLFGDPRLLDALRGAPTADMPDAVLQAVRRFENGALQADDITCVAVRYVGEGDPA